MEIKKNTIHEFRKHHWKIQKAEKPWTIHSGAELSFLCTDIAWCAFDTII